MTRTAIMCAALTASTFFGAMTAARAEDAQMRISLSGLRLDTAEGASAALARIRDGAVLFCGDEGSDRTSLDRTMLSRECQAVMTRKAIDQLGAPRVTALFSRQPFVRAPSIELARK